MRFVFVLPIVKLIVDHLHRGIITALKVSPNLRLKVKPPKKQQNLDQVYMQNQKLEKLLSLVRELPD